MFHYIKLKNITFIDITINLTSKIIKYWEAGRHKFSKIPVFVCKLKVYDWQHSAWSGRLTPSLSRKCLPNARVGIITVSQSLFQLKAVFYEKKKNGLVRLHSGNHTSALPAATTPRGAAEVLCPCLPVQHTHGYQHTSLGIEINKVRTTALPRVFFSETGFSFLAGTT